MGAIDLPEGGWQRLRGSLWVRPPGCQPVRLCALTRVWRIDPEGPTVVGLISGRWVLYNGKWAEVAG